jgi:integrase
MIYKRIGHWHLDVTIHGVRYREALNTTDKRQAKELEKNRIAEIKQGKNASKTGREFARKPFHEAVKVYLEEREPHVSERTMQFEKERLGPLVKHFGENPLLRFKAEDVSGYQKVRLEAGISGRTVNMETGVLRRMLKRAKVWNAISEDVKALPEDRGAVAKVLPPDLKRKLFEIAASRPEWMVAHCAAVLAVSTTCRGVELMNLRWQDIDLFGRVATIRRSKTAAGHRTIPLNGDAMAALSPARTRRCTRQSGTRALRFSRLRGADYRSLTPAKELAHCMAAKRTALEKLESGLMGGPSATSQRESRKAN